MGKKVLESRKMDGFRVSVYYRPPCTYLYSPNRVEYLITNRMMLKYPPLERFFQWHFNK